MSIDCNCGCGMRIDSRDDRGRLKSYVHGHHRRGIPRTKEWKEMMSVRMEGSKNHQWNPDRALIGRVGQDFSKKQRKQLLKDSCAYCDSKENLQLDHIFPIFAGGTNADENAQTLCGKCNQEKRKEDIRLYSKLGEFRKSPNPNWMGNSEPSKDGNIFEGATTSGRVLRRKGTSFRGLEISCGNCERPYIVSMWKLRGYKSRPQPKHHFCSDRCRLYFLNHPSKTVNSTTSPRRESDDIVCSYGITVRSHDKEHGDNIKQFKWKEAATSVSVSNREETIQNTGKSEVFNIVKAKMDQAEMSMKDVLNTALFNAAPAATALTSLATMIDATSTIGDVNSTTNSWWQALVTTSGSFAAQGRSDMLTTWNTLITRGSGANPVDMIMTTPTAHAFYEGSLVPQIRYEYTKSASGSFPDLVFKTAPVKFDTACNSGVMYFLNSEFMELVINSNNDFKMTEFVKPSNQTAKVAQLVVALELTSNNRRRLAKMTTITA